MKLAVESLQNRLHPWDQGRTAQLGSKASVLETKQEPSPKEDALSSILRFVLQNAVQLSVVAA